MSTFEKFLAHVKAHGGEEGDALEAEQDALSVPTDKLPTCAREVLNGGDPSAAYWSWLIANYRG
jgi:hypothetical protein